MEGDNFEESSQSLNDTAEKRICEKHSPSLGTNSVDEESWKEVEIDDIPCTCDDEISGQVDAELLTTTSSDKFESERRSPSKKVSTLNLIDSATGKKPKLRTSKDIYDRLKWDSKSVLLPVQHGSHHEKDLKEEVDTSSVYIGYKDRFLGMCELPLLDFQPGGDIPFHRIYYFRTGGAPIQPFIGRDGEVKVREDNLPEGALFIWDRDSRTDLVFNSGNSTIVEKRQSRKTKSSSHKSQNV